MNIYEKIDKLVVEAKCGSKSSFNEIWEMYQPLVNKIIKKIIFKFSSARQHEFDIKNDCYIYFWDAINDFDFNDKYYFSYFLKRELIKNLLKNLKNKYIINQEISIDDESLFDLSLKNENGKFESMYEEETINALKYAMRKLSAKQLQAIQMYHYDEMTQEDAANKLGISQVGFRKRLQQSYRKIRKIIEQIG